MKSVGKWSLRWNVFLRYRKNFQNYVPKLAVAGVTGDDFEIEDWFSLEF